MKIQLFNFENDICEMDKYINVLEIEDQKLFVRIVQSFNDIANGVEPEETIHFYINDEHVELYNKIDCIIDIFNKDIVTKKINNSLYSKIEKQINENIDILIKCDNHIKEINNILIPFFNEFDFNLKFDNNFKIDDFLKYIKLNIDYEEINILDRILLIIDLESLFHLNEIIVFIDLKKYFTKEDIIEIYKYSKYKNVYIFLIESISSGITNEYERKIIIDNNYDEFLLENQ